MRWNVAAIAILCLRAGAQDSAPCTIGGAVTDELSNKAIERARVIATAGTYSFLRLTGEHGSFCFENLTPGEYHLFVQKTGYVEFIHPVTLAVEPDSPLKPLTVRMTRYGSLSGTVLDAGGELLPGATVTVWQRTRTGPDQVDGTTTDTHGSFHVSQLPPGTYYLSAKYDDVYDQMYAMPFVGSRGQMPREKEVETYYSGSFSLAGATPLEVQAGQRLDSLVLALKKTRLRRVTGTIGSLPHGKFLTYSSATEAGSEIGGAIPIASDGSFAKAGLPPAQYTFLLGDGDTLLARKDVDVTLGDALGITLDPVETADIPAVVRTEGKGPAFRPRPGMSDMMLVEAGSDEAIAVRLTGDGAYRFPGVVPGVYRLHLELGSQPLYLKGVTYGGETQTGDKIDLRTLRDGGLEVTLSPNVAQLQGQVAVQDTESEDLTVILVDGANIVHQTGTDQKGRFRMSAVAPGKYRIYAIESFDDDDWGSPALAKELQTKSVELDLKESEKKQVNLTPVSTDEWTAALKKIGR
jgi:hypothetical protein